MIIKVRSVEAFTMFLKGIGKVAPHCHFKFTKTGTAVWSVNESHTVRLRLFTDAAVSDGDDFEVSFMNVGNLVKSLMVVSSSEGAEMIDIRYEEPLLVYENVVSFKLRTVKFESIEKHVTGDFGTFEDVMCMFETTSEAIGKTVQQMTMFAGQDMNVYLKERGGQVVCDFDNHEKKTSDSIGIPLGTIWKVGTPDRLLCVKLESFKLIGLYPNARIVVIVTTKGILVANSDSSVEFKGDGMVPDSRKVKMTMICSTMKT